MSGNLSIDELWDKYATDPSYFSQLMEYYQEFAEKTAYALSKTLPSHVELDDLVSDGYFGLADAIQKFDSSYGFKFETYAAFRIRGEILDKLRVADWAPRSLRAKQKEADSAKDQLSRELGREPQPDEIASVLGWSVDELSRILGETHSAHVTNLDDVVNVDGVAFKLSDLLPDEHTSVSEFDYAPLRTKVLSAFDSLSDQQTLVLFLYYVEDLSLRQIGDLMRVTESRACQIHTKALERLWDACLPSA